MVSTGTYGSHRPSFIGWFALGLIILAGVWYLCELSRHIQEGNHVGETWDSKRVYDEVEKVNKNPEDKDKICPNDFIIASCPYAINWDKESAFYGQEFPQARVYCGKTATSGIYLVFALNCKKDGFKCITGYEMTKTKFEHNSARDYCFNVDFKFLRILLK